MASTVTVDSAGSAMKLYDAEPDGAPKGAVIVVQEAFGITDYIEDVCSGPVRRGVSRRRTAPLPPQR